MLLGTKMATNLRSCVMKLSHARLAQRLARRKFQALPCDTHNVPCVLEYLVLSGAAKRRVNRETRSHLPSRAKRNCSNLRTRVTAVRPCVRWFKRF